MSILLAFLASNLLTSLNLLEEPPFFVDNTILDGSPSKNCQAYVTVVTIDTGLDTQNKELKKYMKNDMFGNLVGGHTNEFGSFEDQNGHGTHIAWIIARESECVKIVPISYWDEKNPKANQTSNFIKALTHSLRYNPRVINISGGGPFSTDEELIILKEIEKRGILVISAAGNNGKDIDLVENNYFPSSYRLNNMITVASVNSVGDLSETSNYGINSVDVAAFGVKIKSFGLNEQMVSLSGTSQATAQVSGLVSKIVSINPGLTNDQIKSLITKTVDKKIELRDKIRSGGVINKNRAISRSMDLIYN